MYPLVAGETLAGTGSQMDLCEAARASKVTLKYTPSAWQGGRSNAN